MNDEAYQEGAGRFRHQQALMNAREWFDDELHVRRLEQQLEDHAPVFSLAFTFWWPTALILVLVILYEIGVPTMSHDHSQPPAPPAPPVESPAPQGEPHGSTLKAAIDRFARAILSVQTHPDTQMFFFDAQELTVNDRLETLKVQALIDSLCAAGVIERYRFENRLEELVSKKADMLEAAAKRIAFQTITRRPVGKVNGS